MKSCSRKHKAYTEQVFELTKETNLKSSTRPRIIIAMALAELASGVKKEDEGLINKAIQGVEKLKKQLDPADFDPDRADCAAFLYNLATWYTLAYDSYLGDKIVGISNVRPRDEARTLPGI